MQRIIKYALGLAVLAGSAQAAPVVRAVGVESQYADVISQIGGKYVAVTAIETDPNTDPHSFEVNPQIAGRIAAAGLVVENGLGYDDWADKILAASPNVNRKVINVQHLLHLPDKTPNPHLWYAPSTMPAVAGQITRDLVMLYPAQAGYFQNNLRVFLAGLQPWNAAIAAFRAQHLNVAVAVTEPVADYLLTAMGLNITTPFSLQAAIMNGTDPAPQDISAQTALFASHKVQVFIYNQQVTDPLTQAMLAQAAANKIPVVGVYETMPMPGYNYQSWMLAEVAAIDKAVTSQVSTATLQKTP